MTLGEKIKDIRTSQGYNQNDFAEKLGISRKTLWNYENNKRIPDIKILNAISSIFKAPIIELLAISSKDVLSEPFTSEITSIPSITIPTDTYQAFNEFLEACEFPSNINNEDLTILLENTKKFLAYEFFKLGYLKRDNSK